MMNDLVVYLVVALLAVISGGVSYFLSRRNTLTEIKLTLDEKISEKLKDKVPRDWDEEKQAINFNEELRKNKHDRNKDWFVMFAITGLILAGLYFLLPGGTESEHGDAKGWAVGALDTLLGVVVGYGFSKNNSNK